MAPRDEDAPWTRQLAVAVGALVAVALVIGGVVAVGALGAARVVGLGGGEDDTAAEPTAEPSLVMPSGEPTTEVETYPAPDVPEEEADEGSASPSATPSKKPTKKPPAITLQAFPQQVAPGERINLTGIYERGEGAQLQVQRFENGSWTDFPVTTSVTGGQFSTYITTSRSGRTRLRVLDDGSGKKSNEARVLIQ